VTTPPEPAAADADLDQRVTSLEHGQTSISDRLDRVLGFLERTPDEPAEPAEPERPELNIADEIRRQLAQQQRKPRSEPAAAKTDLTEKPPAAPVGRLAKLMGWAE
jgi:hypothetical protein